MKFLFWVASLMAEQIKGRIVWKNEPRRYMGPKWARVPRGEVVELIAVVNGRIGIFRYKGEVVWCPVRLLHRI